jgi:hypothetical protein
MTRHQQSFDIAGRRHPPLASAQARDQGSHELMKSLYTLFPKFGISADGFHAPLVKAGKEKRMNYLTQ